MEPMHFSVRICVRGELGAEWFAAFHGLFVEAGPAGTTVISGDLRDQSAFHGLLAAIRDLGLSLVSVETAASREERATSGSSVRGE